jgi:meso-butanediol dehydrogenase/(S,S)-butanediol dehydrogenase/diacetyl reductase
MSNNRFTSKVALVTGAAAGIGKATARMLAKEGASIWCADINRLGMEDTIGEIRKSGGDAAGSTFDATDAEQARELVTQVIDHFGKLDILCNIAGMVRMVLTQEETPDVWDKVMALNCNGPFYLSLAALPHLLEQKGNIVNLASVAGIMGQAYTAAYCASKHALVGLTKSMALEFGRQGLRVNAICPGAVNTNLIQTISVPDGVDPDLIARYNFAQDAAEADEVAKMIAYVASDEARFVNGAILSIDGGTSCG